MQKSLFGSGEYIKKKHKNIENHKQKQTLHFKVFLTMCHTNFMQFNSQHTTTRERYRTGKEKGMNNAVTVLAPTSTPHVTAALYKKFLKGLRLCEVSQQWIVQSDKH